MCRLSHMSGKVSLYPRSTQWQGQGHTMSARGSQEFWPRTAAGHHSGITDETLSPPLSRRSIECKNRAAMDYVNGFHDLFIFFFFFKQQWPRRRPTYWILKYVQLSEYLTKEPPSIQLPFNEFFISFSSRPQEPSQHITPQQQRRKFSHHTSFQDKCTSSSLLPSSAVTSPLQNTVFPKVLHPALSYVAGLSCFEKYSTCLSLSGHVSLY